MVNITRTSSERYKQFYTVTHFINGTLASKADVNVQEGTLTSSVTFQQSVGKDWKQRIRNRQNATSTLSGTKYSVTPKSDGYLSVPRYTIVYKPGTSDYLRTDTEEWIVQGDLHSQSIPTNSFISTSYADNQARAKFYQSLSQARSTFKGLTFLGELKESLHMIRHPAEAIFKSFPKYLSSVKKQVKKSSAKTLKKQNRVIAGTWLEYVFGWRPLISDIDSGMEALSRLTYYPPIVPIRGKGVDVSKSPPLNLSQPLGYVTLQRNGVYQEQRAEVLYHGVFGSDLETLKGKASNFGFDLSEVFPTVWELIPYSFLVDYFTNIGNIITAFSTPLTGVKWCERGILSSNIQHCDSVAYKLSALGTNQFYGNVSWIPGSAYPFALRSVSRSSMVPDVPSVQLKIPGMSLRWLNIAALVDQSRQTSHSLRLFRS